MGTETLSILLLFFKKVHIEVIDSGLDGEWKIMWTYFRVVVFFCMIFAFFCHFQKNMAKKGSRGNQNDSGN